MPAGTGLYLCASDGGVHPYSENITSRVAAVASQAPNELIEKFLRRSRCMATASLALHKKASLLVRLKVFVVMLCPLGAVTLMIFIPVIVFEVLRF